MTTRVGAGDRAPALRRMAFGAALVLRFSIGPATAGDPAPIHPGPLTIEEAMRFALEHAPAMRAARGEDEAAKSEIDLARTRYLPQLDALWQTNRATRNNTAGLLLPQSVVPAVSGPVEPAPDNTSVWGSAGGLLFSWEPLDFGLRRAAVLAATAAETRASAEESLARLDVATSAGDSFLTMLAAQETTRAAQADVERRQVLARSIHALAQSQLRPEADVSRAEAELAGARIQLIRAQEQERRAKALMAEALGIAGEDVEILPGRLLDSVPPEGLPFSSSIHPLAAARQARVDEAAARAKAEARSYAPHIQFEASYSGRGSGVNPDGTVSSGTRVLDLDRDNWAIGLMLSFHLLDFAADHARERAESARRSAAQARYEEAQQELTRLVQQARASWESARQVAQNTPDRLTAARTNETQVRARYEAGLASITEVADAQRLLVQAEIEDSLARLGVWRARLALADAQGDLRPFLALMSPTRGEQP